MPLTVTTAAASGATDLCTLDDLPERVRGTNHEHDPRLSKLITRVSHAIPRYCHRVFAQQIYREEVAGHGDTLLQIFNSPLSSGFFSGLFPGGPVTAVATVYELDTELNPTLTAITDYFIENAMAGHLYRAAGWSWTAQLVSTLSAHVAPDSERPLYRVAYTAGFTCPQVGTVGTTVEGTLPYDIREAAAVAVEEWFARETRGDASGPVIERRMGDVSLRYASSGTQQQESDQSHGLSKRVQDMLFHWRRW